MILPMNSSCINVDEKIILLFYIFGCVLTIIGTLLNLCLCLLFFRVKSLYNTPYSIFIIALSITDIVKLFSEYFVHILYIYIDHPYFVCSITWFLTMASENLSYSFLCILGIERNLKVWIIDRRYLITRQRACIITLLILIFVCIHDHLFLFSPYDVTYCFIKFSESSIIFSCDNAYYKSYSYKYSLTDLIFIESIGLNNCILPILIILTNILLIFGLKRRAYIRRSHFGRQNKHDWKEQSVILYIFISSITFIFLTLPIGILNARSAVHNQKLATNNLSLLLDLLEILHHCSHFPILLMTSSVIRTKTLQILFQPFQSRRSSSTVTQSTKKQVRWRSMTA